MLDLKIAKLTYALRLGLVHADVGVLKQAQAVFAILREAGNTDASRNMQQMSAHYRRLGKF